MDKFLHSWMNVKQKRLKIIFTFFIIINILIKIVYCLTVFIFGTKLQKTHKSTVCLITLMRTSPCKMIRPSQICTIKWPSDDKFGVKMVSCQCRWLDQDGGGWCQKQGFPQLKMKWKTLPNDAGKKTWRRLLSVAKILNQRKSLRLTLSVFFVHHKTAKRWMAWKMKNGIQ